METKHVEFSESVTRGKNCDSAVRRCDKFAIEGVDYEGVNIMLNGNQTKDFALTIDFAKHLHISAKSTVIGYNQI